MTVPPPPRKLDPLAAVLSYLVPGLGQVMQGRVGKGVLFCVSLYALFFYGMALGQWKNVWLPDARTLPPLDVAGLKLNGVAKSVGYRPQFAGQFWIGAVAWPAVAQYLVTGPDEADDGGAGKKPFLSGYMKTPSERELNDLQRDGNKRWDLGWVYTLIAGVLNLLVIYDALAGPAVRDEDLLPTTAGGSPPQGGGA